MSKEEFDIKKAIINTEERIKYYKELLKEIGMNRDVFPPDDEFVQWIRSFLREQKNDNDSWLKELTLERRYENAGLNPPGCYKDKELSNKVVSFI